MKIGINENEKSMFNIFNVCYNLFVGFKEIYHFIFIYPFRFINSYLSLLVYFPTFFC